MCYSDEVNTQTKRQDTVSQVVFSLPLIEQEEKSEFDSHLHQNRFVSKKKDLKVKSVLGSTSPGQVTWKSTTNVVRAYTGKPRFCGIRSRLTR